MSVYNSIDLRFSPSQSVGIHFRWQKSASNSASGVFMVDGFTDNSPALKMKTEVKKGCKLVRLNGVDLRDRSQNVVVKMMKSCVGEERVLTFLEEKVLPQPPPKSITDRTKPIQRSLSSGRRSRSASPSDDLSTPARRRRIVYEFVKSVYGNYIEEARKLAVTSILRIRAATKIQAFFRSKIARKIYLMMLRKLYYSSATTIQKMVRCKRARKRLKVLRHFKCVYDAATTINNRSRVVMAKTRFEGLLHLHRQRRYQSAITIECFYRVCVAKAKFKSLEKRCFEEMSRKHKAARTIQKMVRGKTAMSYFKFWRQMANEAAIIVNSKFSRVVLAKRRLRIAVKGSNTIKGFFRIILARGLLSRLREDFMKESRELMTQQNQTNKYPKVSDQNSLELGTVQGETSPSGPSTPIVKTPTSPDKDWGEGEREEDEEGGGESPAVWQLRYSPHNKSSLQSNEHFKESPETPEDVFAQQQREAQLLLEAQEVEERLRIDKINLEKKFLEERLLAEEKKKKFLATFIQANHRGRSSRKIVNANKTLLRAGQVIMAKIEMRKRIRIAMTVRKRKNFAATIIQCRVRYNIANGRVTRAREERLLFLTEVMEREYAFNEIRQMRYSGEGGGGDERGEIRNGAPATIAIHQRVPNKWLKVLTENSQPPSGCSLENCTHDSATIKKAGFAHFEMNFPNM